MKEIILENRQFRLTIGEDCTARSLLHKTSGQECLMPDQDLPLFSVTQPRPFNNEVKLAHPNKRTTFQADRVRLEGDKLIIGFEITPYEAVVRVKITDAYISFALEDFIVRPTDYGDLKMDLPPVESFRLMQLPVKNRERFGEWLNVMWDDEVAVNVLATSPYALIDNERRKGFRILTAEADRSVKIKGTEAALIVTKADELLDCIDRLEEDYDLPRGVQSRRSPKIRVSSYLSRWMNPETVDAHIRYCKQCGYGMMTIYYASIFEDNCYNRTGDYWNFRNTYPEGWESLRQVVQKIRDAGIIPGIHFLQTHIGLLSSYVTPVADHRLNLKRHFTLSRPLTAADNKIYVEQNPEGAAMADKCRVLQFGGELITYEAYTTERPYCFVGCTRGAYATQVTEHPLGQIGGILDISEFAGNSCYLDQNTDLQDEIAAQLAKVYAAGFQYVYFDGSEGTNEPYAFHVANSHYRTWKQMKPTPIYTEGAAKSHFSWHLLTGGNAFDVFPPPVFKEMIRRHPADEAVRMRQDLTRLNFGWWITYPDLQPDHWEYGASLAAAWDCPATIQGEIERFEGNSRTDDLLEIIRRWEDVRVNQLLTEDQKKAIRENQMQEHILLIDERREYEVQPYDPVATSDEKLRAYVFTRGKKTTVVYWHADGEGTLQLPMSVELQDELYGQAVTADILPVSHRRYASSTDGEALIRAFESAQLV